MDTFGCLYSRSSFSQWTIQSHHDQGDLWGCAFADMFLHLSDFLWFCLNTVSFFRLRSWVFMEIWSISGWTQRLLWGSSCQNVNMMTQLSKQKRDKCLWRVCTLQPYTQTTGMPFTNHHSQKGWLCAKLPCKRHHNFFSFINLFLRVCYTAKLNVNLTSLYKSESLVVISSK